MLNTIYIILPPVLIVLSFAGILMILFKKAPDLASLEEREEDLEEGFFKKIVDRKKLGNKTLLVLEKIFRKFKLFFLRLENVFSSWSETVKNKRRIKENEGRFSRLSDKKEMSEDELERKADDFFQRKEEEKNSSSVAPTQRINVRESFPREKKEPRKKIPEKKDIFEKILIERIAANPKDVEAYERLGEYYFEIENWNYSKECFKQVIKLSPQNRSAKMKMKKLEKILTE